MEELAIQFLGALLYWFLPRTLYLVAVILLGNLRKRVEDSRRKRRKPRPPAKPPEP